MSEEMIKRKLNNAIKSAITILDKPKGACMIIRLNDSRCPFHIEHCRNKEVRKIRITINEITPEDRKLCRAWDWSLNEAIFTKEIWCKKVGGHGFDPPEII